MLKESILSGDSISESWSWAERVTNTKVSWCQAKGGVRGKEKSIVVVDRHGVRAVRKHSRKSPQEIDNHRVMVTYARSRGREGFRIGVSEEGSLRKVEGKKKGKTGLLKLYTRSN